MVTFRLHARLIGCLMALVVPSNAEEIEPQDAMLSGYTYPFPLKSRSFSAQGQLLEMAYMDLAAAKPNGKTVVLLHGKNFSGAYWKDTATSLAEKGYRVIMPDQIGFGKSSKPLPFQYSLHDMAYQTKALLDSLDLTKLEVVGHSMGGMVATRFSLMYPASVEKLVLVNPIGLEDWKRVVPYQSIDEATQAEAKKSPSDVKKYMQDAYFDGRWQPSYDPLIAIQGGWTVGPDREKMARISALTSEMVMTQPVVYEFPDLKVPTLLIIGDRDRTAIGKNLVSKDVAATLGQYQKLGPKTAEVIPRAKLVVLPGIGHAPQVEDFGKYLQVLVDFL